MIAVDHQIDAIDLGVREIHQAHDRGDTHRPRQNRDVGVAGTLHRHQTDQFAFRHFAKHGRGQLFADQNSVVGVNQCLLPLFLQVRQQAAAQVLDVRGPLAQVSIVHQLKAFDVLADHRAQGALCPFAGLDDIGHLAAQRGIVEHHQVDIEQRALFGAQLRGELGGQGAHVVAHAFQCILEQRQLGSDISDGLVRDNFQIGRRQHDHCDTDGGTRRAGHTDKLGFLNALALATQTANRAGGFGMRDNARQLRTHGDKEGFFALVELTALLLLDHQYANHTAVVDDRRPQKRGITLFTGLGEVAITRVIRGVFEVQRFFARTDQTNKAFVRRHADFADGTLVEAFGGHQHKTVHFGIEQVDRADLAAHGLLDAQHNNAQRRLEILGGVNFLDDLAQRIEHGSGSNSVSVAR
ncbi:UDP-N-acetylmuramyl pentapeptide synthase [Pseudomonas syringae pv. actinidiae]|uniref:UDP-N-acetylmuramyl pentapeptide synthase n=1 Tax=Pseudomonas syringae pv. actinidiae TaxID=103796 RepID=A0AAN4QBE3_PSESF|nr:UDP-N-acetylmuramyl pentapeptide synthase [Pseudomonas syringae pv. actinidiae]